MDISGLGSYGNSETGRVYLCLLICNFLYIKGIWKQMGNLDLWGYERNKKNLLSKFFCFPSSSSVFSSWHEWSWGKMNTIKKHKLSFMLEAWICEVVLRLLFLAIAKDIHLQSYAKKNRKFDLYVVKWP